MDSYDYLWKAENITETKNVIEKCSSIVLETTGNASWMCEYDDGKCRFKPATPDYSNCSSKELENLLESVKEFKINKEYMLNISI